MAYGEKYKYHFYWGHDSTQNEYKVSILKDGYASTVTTLTAGTNPFSINIKGQKDSIEQVILGSEAEFNIIVVKADVSDIDGDFLESEYGDLIVKLIQDPDGTPLVKWTGIIKPENASRNFYGNKYNYALSAVDGLAELKDKKFTSTGEITGSSYTGFQDILAIIKTAILKVASFSELQLDFRVQLGTYSNEMTSTENALKESEVAQDMFFEQKEDGRETDTCYEVIEKVLAPFYCRLMQSDGYYWIVCGSETDSYYFEYDWSTLTQQSRTSSDLAVNTSTNFGRGNLYKIPPPNNYAVIVYNKEYESVLLSNGDFDSNITGWSNGSPSVPTDAFSSIAWYDYPYRGGTLGADWSGAAEANDYHFHTTNTFTLSVGPGVSSVTVSLQCELNSETRSGGASAIPLIRMRLYNATDLYTVGSNGQQGILGVGGFYVFNDTFDVTGLTVANNYLDIEIETQDVTTSAIQLYFDDIVLNQPSGDVPRDWMFPGNRSSGSQLPSKERIIYLAERQESTADSCAIKDGGGNYVTDWDRYGKTDGDPIANILQQQIFNDNNTYMNYVKTTIYDENENINIHNKIYDSVNYYKLIGMRRNFREASADVDMVEEYTGSDVSFATSKSKLSTSYGEDIE